MLRLFSKLFLFALLSTLLLCLTAAIDRATAVYKGLLLGPQPRGFRKRPAKRLGHTDLTRGRMMSASGGASRPRWPSPRLYTLPYPLVTRSSFYRRASMMRHLALCNDSSRHSASLHDKDQEPQKYSCPQWRLTADYKVALAD